VQRRDPGVPEETRSDASPVNGATNSVYHRMNYSSEKDHTNLLTNSFCAEGLYLLLDLLLLRGPGPRTFMNTYLVSDPSILESRRQMLLR
jgi:hypothetical protein